MLTILSQALSWSGWVKLQQAWENVELRVWKLRGLHSSYTSLIFFVLFFSTHLFLFLVPTNSEPGIRIPTAHVPFKCQLHVLWMCAVRALCECLFYLLFRCQKTVPQVLLRWSIQKNYITIPKTSRKERILENADIFDFALSAEDMKILVSINRLMLFPLRRMNSLILDSDNFNFKVLDSFRIGLRRYFSSWQFSDSFGSHFHYAVFLSRLQN